MRLNPTSALVILAASFRIPEFNLQFHTKQKGLQKEFFFRGNDAVNCLVNYLGVSRDNAIMLGGLLISADLMKCESFTSFRDDDTTYRIVETQLEDKNFLLEYKKKIPAALIHGNLKITPNIVDDISFIQRLTTEGIIEYLIGTRAQIAPPITPRAQPPSPDKVKRKTTAITKLSGQRQNSLKIIPSPTAPLMKEKFKEMNKENKAKEKKAKDKSKDKKDDKIKDKATPVPPLIIDVTNNDVDFFEEDTEDIRFTISESSSYPKVKSASIDKLIERLTHEVYPDLQFRTTFMLTYRSFMTPHQLLQKLSQRFHSTNVEGATLKTIQLRVVGTIKSWLETFFDDFSDDQSLQDALKDFLQTIIPVMGQPAQQILTLLQKGGNRNVSEESSIAPKENINFDDLHFEDLDENEIANQLCMREFKIYSAILVNEILNLNWSKHKERSPNVLALIEQFNRISYWVQYEIVKPLKLADRVANLNKFILLGYKLCALNNFNGVMEILAGINSSPVRRLKKTWEEIPEATKVKLKFLEAIMSHEGSYREYRTKLHNCDPPTIPYLGTYLTDLTFIEDGNPDMDGSLINFDKRYKVAAVIGEIQQYQRIGYSFNYDWKIQSWLNNLPTVDEEEAYRISLKVEPRNPDEALENLLMEEQRLREEVKALQLRNADLEESNRQFQVLLNKALVEVNKLKRMTRPGSTSNKSAPTAQAANTGVPPPSQQQVNQPSPVLQDQKSHQAKVKQLTLLSSQSQPHIKHNFNPSVDNAAARTQSPMVGHNSTGNLPQSNQPQQQNEMRPQSNPQTHTNYANAPQGEPRANPNFGNSPQQGEPRANPNFGNGPQQGEPRFNPNFGNSAQQGEPRANPNFGNGPQTQADFRNKSTSKQPPYSPQQMRKPHNPNLVNSNPNQKQGPGAGGPQTGQGGGPGNGRQSPAGGLQNRNGPGPANPMQKSQTSPNLKVGTTPTHTSKTEYVSVDCEPTSNTPIPQRETRSVTVGGNMGNMKPSTTNKPNRPPPSPPVK